MEKAAKKILIGIGIFFLTVFILFISTRIFLRIYSYSTRTESLQYTYDLIKSKELIGMDYSDCCNYLESVENEYVADFSFLYEVNKESYIDGQKYSCLRVYVAGDAINESGRWRFYNLKVYFNDDGEVIYAFIEERKA